MLFNVDEKGRGGWHRAAQLRRQSFWIAAWRCEEHAPRTGRPVEEAPEHWWSSGLSGVKNLPQRFSAANRRLSGWHQASARHAPFMGRRSVSRVQSTPHSNISAESDAVAIVSSGKCYCIFFKEMYIIISMVCFLVHRRTTADFGDRSRHFRWVWNWDHSLVGKDEEEQKLQGVYEHCKGQGKYNEIYVIITKQYKIVNILVHIYGFVALFVDCVDLGFK